MIAEPAPVQPARRGRSARVLVIAIVGLVAVIAIAVALGIASPAPNRVPAAVATQPAAPDDAGAAAPTPDPSATFMCTREPGQVPTYLASDPCPSAIEAVQAAVATVRMPIERMATEPGPLFCGVIWEGYGSPAVCFGPDIRPGQYMHAYVSFADSDKVAVVMLGLDLPADDNDPAATRPPWQTTLVAFDTPPIGWAMP